jgi:hypothetical protein
LNVSFCGKSASGLMAGTATGIIHLAEFHYSFGHTET